MNGNEIMTEAQVHMLSTYCNLNKQQIDSIMEVLGCSKVIHDKKRKIYYFLDKTCLQNTPNDL